MKYRNSLFHRLYFWLKFVGLGFVSSIISSQVSTKPSIILAKYLLFLQLHVAGFGHLLLFHFWFELHFLPSNLLLHLHDVSFISVMMLKTLTFESSVSFRTHTLLDKS